MGSLLPCALQGRGTHASVWPLVVEPGQTFLPAEDGQDIEYTRGSGAPGECRAQGLSDGAELEAVLVGKGPHRGFGLFGGPVFHCPQGNTKSADQQAVFRRQQGGG